MVMPISATTAAIQPSAVVSPAALSWTMSATPAMPSSSPTHCRGITRSPSQRLASVVVSTGCRLTTSATRPAGRCCWSATNTPPR